MLTESLLQLDIDKKFMKPECCQKVHETLLNFEIKKDFETLVFSFYSRKHLCRAIDMFIKTLLLFQLTLMYFFRSSMDESRHGTPKKFTIS